MEHIKPCSGITGHPTFQTPRVCNDEFTYDGLGFLSYPARAGIDTPSLREDSLPLLRLKDSNSFIQAWIWFGLLSEALVDGPGAASPKAPTVSMQQPEPDKRDPPGIEEFVVQVEGQYYLCSTRLVNLIAWVKHRYQDAQFATWHRKRMRQNIGIAMNFLCKFMKEQRMSTQDILNADGTLRMLPGTLLCCQLLCQALLDHVLDSKLMPTSTDEALTWTDESLGIVDHLLRQSNWEVKEIRKLPMDVSFRYHLSFYRVSPQESVFRDDAQHVKDDEVITPVHTKAGCDCGLIGPSNSSVDNSTQQENVIFFNVHRLGPSSSHLERAEVHVCEDVWPPFVAISHVRRHGLGNGQDNKLPSCQLSALQSLVNQLQPNDTASGTFFWIDSLCLPVTRELRKQAFLLQPVIFSRARQVLVVDPPIFQWPYGSPEEALIRIRYSVWKSRVWTLLEGYLTQNLVFLFSNGMVDLDKILIDFEKSSGEESDYLPVLRRNSNPDLDRLPAEAAEILRAMKPFTRDIMTWASEAKRTQAAPLKYGQVNQSVLYTQLRLGCLSSPKFRLLVERDEARDIPGVCQSLIEVYGNYNEKSQDKDIARIVARLGEMCLLGQKRMELLSE